MEKLLLGVGLVTCLSSCLSSTEKEKPNIIYILADDMGYGDLSCYGQTHFLTPNIDKLATRGVRFTQHYCGSTVCAPSRSSLMTGQHTGHTPIRGNKGHQPEGQVPMGAEAVTVAELLHSAGYVTGAFGKWGLGYPGSEGDPNKQGFDEFFGYNCQSMAHHYYPRHLWHNQEKVILEGNKGTATGTYAPDLIHEKTLEFIEKNKDNRFFLFVPSIIPHAELFVTEEYMAKYRGKFMPERVYHGVDSGPHYRKGRYGSQPEAHAAFAGMINLLDDQVGEIVRKVEELGLSENTIIMFASDNGPHMEGGADPDYFNSNGGLRGYKRDLYEGGIRSPFIACWPGRIKPGRVSNHVSAFWDLLPTMTDLAGIETPHETDGISFLPTLLGEQKQDQHPWFYWEFHELGGRQAVRMGNWKGVKNKVINNPDAPLELYNLEEDSQETNDISAMHPEVVQEITDILKTARTESAVFKFNKQ